MAEETNLGVARAYLDIDASDWNNAVAAAKNSAAGLGVAAEKAFDQATAAQKRASNQLLTYAAGLGKTAEQQKVLTALMKGVPVDVAKAAAASMEKTGAAIAAATARQEEFNAAFGDATGIDKARNALEQYIAELNKSQQINPHIQKAADAGVDTASLQRATAAYNAFEQKQREVAAEQERFNATFEDATGINNARNALEQYIAELNKSQQINPHIQSAIDAGVDSETIAKSVSALDAYTAATAEAQAAQQKLAQQQSEAAAIDAAFNAQRAENTQRYINDLLGVSNAEDKAATAQQRRYDAQEAFSKLPPELPTYNANTGDYTGVAQTTDKATASQDAFIKSLQSQYDAAGKSHYEMLELRAAELGVSDAAAPMIQKLKDQAQAMRGGTISAKQYEFAMRGLPAQFTDIVVSLQAGQNPFTVFLQQGGQIKDMLGGVQGALSGVGAYLAKFINPWTVTGAAIAGTVAVIYELSTAQDTLTRAFSDTPNTFKLTGAAVEDMADKMGAQGGTASVGELKDAMAGLAGVQTSSVDRFESMSKAVASWSEVTGGAVSTAADEYKSLASDPYKSLLTLAEATGDVTAAELAHVKALSDAGDAVGAADAAQDVYSKHLQDITDKTLANLSAMGAAWLELKNTISLVANEAKNDWPDLLPPVLKPAAMYAVNALGNSYKSSAAAASLKGSSFDTTGAGSDWDASTASTTTLTAAQAKAQGQLSDILDKGKTDVQKYNDGVKQLNGTLAQASAATLKLDNVTKNADGTFSGPGYQQMLRGVAGYKNPTTQDDGAQLAQIKKDAAAQQAQIASETQFTQGQYALRQITVDDYYTQLEDLSRQSTAVTVASLQKQMAVEQAHSAGLVTAGMTQSQIDNARKASMEQIAGTQSDIDAAETEGTTKLNKLYIEQAEADQRRTDANQAYQDSLDDTTRSIQRNATAMVDKVSMGDQEYAQQQALNDIYDKQSDALAKLKEQYTKDGDQVSYDTRSAALAKETTNAVNTTTDSYANLKDAQGNALNGMDQAWKNFRDSSDNLAAGSKEIWTDAFDSIGEAAANLATGTGTSFADIAKTIESTAIKVLANKAVSQLLQSFGGLFPSLSGGGTGTAANAAGMGEATDWGGLKFAKGGVGNSPSLSAYSNGVYNTPQHFMFAKGDAGTFGEAGDEAIMPLQRDGNGSLGVKATGASAAPVVNLTIIGAPGTPKVTQTQTSKGVDIQAVFGDIDTQIAAGIMSGTSKTSVAIKHKTGGR